MTLEHRLGDIEVTEFQAAPALQCLVHTLLFVRAPRPVCPAEARCEQFNLTYARCGCPEDDRLVDNAIDNFLRPLLSTLKKSQGSEHSERKVPRACLTLSFFEKQEKKKNYFMNFFGAAEERVFFEKWIIPISIIQTSPSNPYAGQHIAEEMLRKQMYKVFEIVNDQVDHIPSKEYYFEISPAYRGEKREPSNSRGLQSPSLIDNIS
mmetsp:Transcript_2058/g.2767  ORF Transcript_2058/g.2767 Transcript_2058/m.2767 type:complete len:207 (+) Transcript_2058:114-734(+)